MAGSSATPQMNNRDITTSSTIRHRFVLLGTRKGVVLLEDENVVLLISSDLMSASELPDIVIGDVLLGGEAIAGMKYDPLFEEPLYAAWKLKS